jgi:protein-L-isoaspartate O-methyltransferase
LHRNEFSVLEQRLLMRRSIDECLLEGGLSRPREKALRKICAHSWDSHTKAMAPSRAFDDVVFRRHDNSVKFAVPWVSRHIDLSETHIVDLGCGCGSSSLAFSHFAKHVTGLEVDKCYANACRRRMRIMGVRNFDCIQTEPDRMLDVLKSVVGKSSSIL